jgi:hypothetical protein
VQTSRSQFRLQDRRNGGDWTDVEAHDFPHPLRELDLDFADVEVGATPRGWSVAQGDAAGLSVAAAGKDKVLRAEARQEPLIGLYTPPWPANQLAAEFRLPPDGRNGLGLVFGYVDPETTAVSSSILLAAISRQPLRQRQGDGRGGRRPRWQRGSG